MEFLHKIVANPRAYCNLRKQTEHRRKRRLFLETLEARMLLTNTIFASPGGWYEYDAWAGDPGHEVASMPAVASISRNVEEGPTPASGMNSPTTCGPSNTFFS